MDFATLLWIVSWMLEAILLAVLSYRKTYRALPFFFNYIVWTLLSDIAVFALDRSQPSLMLPIYVTQTVVEAGFEFLVLIELAWSALQSVWIYLPRHPRIQLGFLIACLGIAFWPMAGKTMPANIAHDALFAVHFIQTAAMLRIACFILLAAFSKYLILSWKDREFRVAAGLAFYSMISLFIAVLERRLLSESQYQFFDHIVVLSYILTLTYWIISFSRQHNSRRTY